MSGRSSQLMVRIGRAVRGLWPNRNPLRRTTDRIEAGIVAALLALFMILTPMAAVFAGRFAYGASLRAERAQQAKWHQVAAVLVEDGASAEYGATAIAQWTTPSGEVRAAEITVPAGSKAGTTVKVWVDSAGRLTGSPMQGSDVAGNVIVATLGAVAAVGILLLSAGAAAHVILGRKRLAAWDADWRATGPQWTHLG
jgi:hypothetical protein